MENASKALIIAGAILLAIVLVSLGVLVINNARKDIDNQTIDQASIEAFNSKITVFCGNDKTGTEMNNLISAISSSNGSQLNKAEKHYISIKVDASVSASVTGDTDITGEAEATSYPIFDNTIKYKATYKTGKDGYVNYVGISKK